MIVTSVAISPPQRIPGIAERHGHAEGERDAEPARSTSSCRAAVRKMRWILAFIMRRPERGCVSPHRMDLHRHRLGDDSGRRYAGTRTDEYQVSFTEGGDRYSSIRSPTTR